MPPSPDTIGRERIGTIKKNHSRDILLEQLKSAQEAHERLQLQKDETSEHAEQDFLIAKKRLELFDNEHDPTGAWKGKRFGRDIAKIFENEFTAEAHGQLVPTEALKQTHMLVVSMGELDRLNREGGHKLGDSAMLLTQKQITDTVEAMLFEQNPDIEPEELSKRYDVYRTGGNEFSIVMRGIVSPGSVQDLASSLNRVDAVTEENQGVEAPPLITNSVSMEEVYEVLNTVRREDGMQDFLSRESGEKTRIAVNIVKEIALTENDIRKTSQRLKRFEMLLREANISGDDKKATAFYDQYLKKALGTIFSGNEEVMVPFLEAKAFLEKKGAFDADWTPEWEKEKEQLSINEGFKHFRKAKEADRTGEWNLQQHVAELVKNRYAKGDYLTAQPEQTTPFEAPKLTRGAETLKKMHAIAETAKEAAAGGHNLLLTKQAEAALLDYQIEAARRDGMTGLEERGVLYEHLEDALSRNQQVTTLFIDMAFLKYFDKVGGKKVGDAAIKKAAEILDEVAQNPRWKEEYKDISIKVYRYAGDEFSIIIEGADESVIEVIRKEIKDRAMKAGQVPSSDAESAYEPTHLSFNIGASYSENTQQLEHHITELGLPLHGEPGSKKRLNHLAEYALRFSDKEIEINKAMDRYTQLINLINTRGIDDAYTKQIIAYSQKAIFGNDGLKKIVEWAQKLKDDPKNAELKIAAQMDLLEFTLLKKNEELKDKHEQDREIESRIERHIREQYFERKISGLEERITDLEKDLSELKAENIAARESLTAQKATYEEERDALKGIRDRMNNTT